MRPPLVYALHSGNLYGTERMALATAEALEDRFYPIICAPPGPALDEARRRGMQTRPFTGLWQFAQSLRPILASSPSLACVCTGVTQSLVCSALNAVYRRRLAHLHIVHGGADEALSYGNKKRLLPLDISFVAVSDFVRQRLAVHGVPLERVEVIENFLTPAQIKNAGRRVSRRRDGVRNVAVVSRVDPIKRLDLLLDTLDRHPRLGRLSFRVSGSGWDLERLRQRSRKTHPNVDFLGFNDDVGAELHNADLLLHLCPEEPFGLAILEAMAVGLPVLVPSSGGAGSLVESGRTGFHFQANDADSLAMQLEKLSAQPSESLERVGAGGRAQLHSRFSAVARAADYGRLLTEKLV
jgi:glycosyltransferase involved in cell wall biosynthesis